MELSLRDLRELVAPGVPASPSERIDLGLQIVVLHRGWVVVGKTSRTGDEVTVEDARCIRRWGTTDGLGHLAESGPIPPTPSKTGTVLDKMGRVTVHHLGVVLMLACNTGAWNGR